MDDTILFLLRILFVAALAFALVVFVVFVCRDAKAFAKDRRVSLSPSDKQKRIAVGAVLLLLLLFGAPLLSANGFSGYLDVVLKVLSVAGIVIVRTLPGVLLLYFFVKSQKKSLRSGRPTVAPTAAGRAQERAERRS